MRNNHTNVDGQIKNIDHRKHRKLMIWKICRLQNTMRGMMGSEVEGMLDKYEQQFKNWEMYRVDLLV